MNTNANPNTNTNTHKSGEHLGYLLSAYLFQNLSAAGVKNVETHLQDCDQCRAELATLRQTLGQVEATFKANDENKTYVFEEARRLRVLEAAWRREIPVSRLRNIWSHWGRTAVAALFLCCLIVGMMMPTLSRARAPMKSASAYPASAPAAAEGFAKSGEREGRKQEYTNSPSPAAPTPPPQSDFDFGLKGEPSDAPATAHGIFPAGGGPGLTTQPDDVQPSAAKEFADFKNPGFASDYGGKSVPAPVTLTRPRLDPNFPIKTAKEASDVVVPPEMLAKAELGDHYETDNMPALRPALARRAESASNKSKEASDVVVSQEMLAKAELGDHFETDNMDRDANDGDLKDVAIASKNETISNQRALIAQDQADKDALSEQNQQLAEKNLKQIEAYRERGQEVSRADSSKIFKRIEVLDGEPAGGGGNDGGKDVVRSLVGGVTSFVPVTDGNNGVLDPGAPGKPADPGLHYYRDNSSVSIRKTPTYDVHDLSEKDKDFPSPVADGMKRFTGPDGVTIDLPDTNKKIVAKKELDEVFEKGSIGRIPKTVDLEAGSGPVLEQGHGMTYAEAESLTKNKSESQGKQRPLLGTNLAQAPAGLRHQFWSNEASSPENLLRGYRYFHAQNTNLSFSDYARRPSPVPPALLTDEGLDEDEYIARYGTRPFVDCQRDSLSTFGMDVDTASYTHSRQSLRQGRLPDQASVRVEEFLNNFKQPYQVSGPDAFGVFVEGSPSPFVSGASTPSYADERNVDKTSNAGCLPVPAPSSGLEVLKIGIKSRQARADERKPAMLTFCIDTSGSMTHDNRLDLVRKALTALVMTLNPEDAVAIVGFADQAELVLPRTQAKQRQRILDAINTLKSDGATDVESGLNMAYRLADESYSADSVNRIVLCSDGVANIGAKGPDEMLKLVKVFSARGIELSTVGFGKGQYNDQMMVKLADHGNGSSHFVDSEAAARKIFTEQLPPHLTILAKDAKVQVVFNPEVVERYRLLGYEKRKIADKDFRNDKIDSGDVAHDTLVTALYEIKRKPMAHGSLGKVFLRWKDAGYRHLPVVERNYPLSEGVMAGQAKDAKPEFRFLMCVARFAELLRDSPWVRDSSYAAVLEELNRLPESFKQRADCREILELVSQAQKLSINQWARECK